MTGHDVRQRVLCRAIVTVAAAALAASAAQVSARGGQAGGQKPAHSFETSSPRVDARVSFAGTQADGPGNAGWAGGPLRLGQPMTVGVETGRVGNAELCAESGVGTTDPASSTALHHWRVTVQPVVATDDRIILDIDWKRFDALPGGGREVRAGDRRRITLAEGRAHVLDFVSAAPGAPSRCLSVSVQVDAFVVPDPALARATLGYDLWLTESDAAGREVTRHVETAARHKETVGFRFLPIGWTSDGAPAPESGGADVVVEVSGTLKGRLQADGSVEVVVKPASAVRLGRESGSAGFGEKRLTVKSDETVRMDIPASGPPAVRAHRVSLSLTVRVR
jgi:hypothetical protein